MASTARFANVVGKQLGPEWQILRWRQVEIDWPKRSDPYFFASKAIACAFVDKIRKKYPDAIVYNWSVYVLTTNGGKTVYKLPRVRHRGYTRADKIPLR